MPEIFKLPRLSRAAAEAESSSGSTLGKGKKNVGGAINILKIISGVCGLFFLTAYLLIALSRINYPYELEWMEGGMVDSVRRVLEGERLYVQPSLRFVPFVYAPLYYYVGALVSSVVGTGFFALRLISFLASLGCGVMIFFLNRRESGKGLFAPLLAVCFFAAIFEKSGAWFDLARIDSLFLLFLLGGVYLLRFAETPSAYIAAGILFFLSFMTKQTALLVFLPFVIYSLYADRRGGGYFAGTAFALMAVSTLILDWLHDGWYAYYLFRVPGGHAIVRQMIWDFWAKDLLPVAPALVIGCTHIYSLVKGGEKRKGLFYLAGYCGMIGAAWLSRMHSGGAENVVIPAYAALSLTYGAALHADVGPLAPRRKYKEILLLLLCIIQFIVLAYNPARQRPSPEVKIAGGHFVSALSEMKGEIFVPYHGYLPALAGKRTYAHAMGLYDIWGSGNDAAKAALKEELRRAVRDHYFDALVLDSGQFLKDWFEEQDFEGYDLTACPQTWSGYGTITGMQTSPQIILRPPRGQK